MNYKYLVIRMDSEGDPDPYASPVSVHETETGAINKAKDMTEDGDTYIVLKATHIIKRKVPVPPPCDVIEVR